MTRMPPFRIILGFALFSLLAVIALMPLGTAAGAIGVSARSSQGTIMSGALRDAAVGRVRMGDVNARLRLTSLLMGRLSFALARGDSPHAPGVSGAVGRGFGGFTADGLSMTLDGSSLIQELAGAELRFETFSFAFSGNKCATASGVIRLAFEESALGQLIKGGMIGNAECSNGDLFVPLVSQSTMERAFVRIKGDGKYQLTLIISEPAAEVGEALGAAGFKPIAGGYRLVRSGKLR